jgi:3-hydroxybutyryl-CoA dehydrogenase
VKPLKEQSGYHISLHFTLSMINKICVCGAGTMGSGIAQLSASSGFATVLYEVNKQVLDKAKATIENVLQMLVEKKKLTAEEKGKVFRNIHFTDRLNDCRADLVIEAIIENAKAKTALFDQLGAINDEKTIFATNTSSLSVTEIADTTSTPGRVIGMHFFNPAPVMKLVEVVNTVYTSDETTRVVIDVAKQMGKIPVVCKDSPGFIVNRVARPYYIESLRLLEEGEVKFETIDELLEASGFKLGPFKLMDLIGNDVNYSVSCSVYEQLNKPERLRPSFIQEQKVENGELGKKTWKGYYNYNK